MRGRDPRDGVGDAIAFGMGLPIEGAGRMSAFNPTGSSPVRGETPYLNLGGVAVVWAVSGLLSWVAVTAVVGLLRWAIR